MEGPLRRPLRTSTSQDVRPKDGRRALPLWLGTPDRGADPVPLRVDELLEAFNKAGVRFNASNQERDEPTDFGSVVRDLKAANATAQSVIDVIACDPDGVTSWTPVYGEMVDEARVLAERIDRLR